MVSSQLPGALLSLWPKYLGYVLSFVGISAFWLIHHSIFRHIRSYDRVSLPQSPVPHGRGIRALPHSLLGEYGDHQLRWPSTPPPSLLAGCVDSPTLVRHEGRISCSRTSGPRYGSLLPQTGPHDFGHFHVSIVISFFSVSVAICTWLVMLLSIPSFSAGGFDSAACVASSSISACQHFSFVRPLGVL